MAKVKPTIVYKLVAPARGATFLSRLGNAKYTIGKVTKGSMQQGLSAYKTIAVALDKHADQIGMGIWTVLACEAGSTLTEDKERVVTGSLKPVRNLGTFNSLPMAGGIDGLKAAVKGQLGSVAETLFMRATKPAKAVRKPAPAKKKAVAKKVVKKVTKKVATKKGKVTRR